MDKINERKIMISVHLKPSTNYVADVAKSLNLGAKIEPNNLLAVTHCNILKRKTCHAMSEFQVHLGLVHTRDKNTFF